MGLAVAVVAAGGAYLWVRVARPELYRPGEENPEITSNLARGLPADAPAPSLVDITAEAGLAGFRTFPGVRTSQLPEDMGSGAAWGDYDGDGDDDLFLVSAGGPLGTPEGELAPSELYENLGNGTFRRVENFPDTRIHGMGAAWGDYDGDGLPDLAVSGYRTLLLFHNDGGGRFTRVDALRVPPDGFWAGLAWGDFDNDRDLDLYVCGYVRYEEAAGGATRATSQQYGAAVPYTLNPASYEPEPNLLFENLGHGRFREVAAAFGVSDPAGRSLSALWHDFDDDGRLDLYVANDISDNALYLNRGATFEDAGLSAWVADYRGAMGLAVGDWNRDGDDDLFVTHWVAQENALFDSRLADLARAPGASPGAVRLTFSDLASPLGLGQIAIPMVGWGTEMVDLDGDGWLDLAVANGSTLERKDDPSLLAPQPAFLFWNRRGEHYYDLAPGNPALAAPHVSRGLAVADYDGDGDPDLLIVHLGEGVQLLRNDMAHGHWLELRLRSRTAGGETKGDGNGARVTVTLPGEGGGREVALRRAVGGASYLSQSSHTLTIGLGGATRAEAVEVRWLGGGADTYRDLEADAAWELTEGDPSPRRLHGGPGASPVATATAAPPGEVPERERVVRFWAAQRAAMDAVKREGDVAKAIPLFRRALALDPDHEDARYYLAACLAARGDLAGAIRELEELVRRHPGSHRGHKQLGIFRAFAARSDADLAAAEGSLERALELNKEETGALLALGEVALLRHRPREAEERLGFACRTNPKAVGGFFLRGYLAWKRGDGAAARALLDRAREARGPDWKPEGAVAEGDVEARMHLEETPLAGFWRRWDGTDDPVRAFVGLDRRLVR